MAELLFTSSLDPIEQGQTFPKSLPRHVTVWQYFDLPDSHMNEFIADAGGAIEAFSPLEIEGVNDAKFGPNNDVDVRQVKALGKNGLIALHTSLGLVINRNFGYIRNPEWAYEGYNPHVTYINGRALEEGEHATLQTVELIEKNAETNAKFVRKVWKLEDV